MKAYSFLIVSLLAYFFLIDARGQRHAIEQTEFLAIKASDGRFVSAEDAGNEPLIANRKAVGNWEVFRLVKAEDGKFAFQSIANSKFVTHQNDEKKPLVANRDKAGEWETFELIYLEKNFFGLKAHTGKFISAKGGGGDRLYANRDRIQEWETFELLPLNQFGLKSYNGDFFTVKKKEVRADGNGLKNAGMFSLKNQNGKTYLVYPAEQPYYLSASEEKTVLVTSISDATPIERVQQGENGNLKFQFKTADKVLLTVGGGGFGLVLSDGKDHPEWTILHLIPQPEKKQSVNVEEIASKGEAAFEEEKEDDFSSIGKYTNHLLLLAVDDYKHWSPLSNAVSDAKKVKEVLTRRYNFSSENIIELYNEEVTLSSVHNTMKKLAKELNGDDNLLIYYSGHGYYEKDLDEGYWVPAEAEKSAPYAYIDNGRLKNYLANIDAKHIFLVADACFSGSLFAAPTRGEYEDEVEQFKSRWALTSGRLELVSDGKRGERSPFAHYFIEYLESNSKERFPVSKLVQYVKETVARNSSQTPDGAPLQGVGDARGEFVFYLKPE